MYFVDSKSKDNNRRVSQYDPRQDIRESAAKKQQSSDEELFRSFSKKTTKMESEKPTYVIV